MNHPLIARLLCVLPLLLASSFLAAQPAVTNRPVPLKAPVGPRTPNIILIVADDLGWGDLGCYGQKKIKTPNLDRLAAEGTRFTQYYAGAPADSASRAALLTGMHSGHGYIRGDKGVALRLEDRLVSEVLKAGGYNTCALGKWALGAPQSTAEPFRRGFDQWAGFVDQVHANNYYPAHIWRYDPNRIVQKVVDGKAVFAKDPFEGMLEIYANKDGRRVSYAQDLLTKMALEYSRINRPFFDNGYRPFFLYLSYTTPHANLDLTKKTGNGMEVPTDAPYEAQRWPLPEKNKAAMITRLDADIGKLMAALRQNNMDEQTVVIFTSDNGPHAEGGNDPAFFESAGPFRGIKRDLYEGGIRAPMIVRWTGKTKPNTVSQQVWAAWDMLPTLAEIARVSPPSELDGISMFPTLLGLKQEKQHDFLYWETHEGVSKQAARMGDWKAIRPSPGKALELYNLKEDSSESRDVAANNPEVVVQFEKYLRTARTGSQHWPILTEKK